MNKLNIRKNQLENNIEKQRKNKKLKKKLKKKQKTILNKQMKGRPQAAGAPPRRPQQRRVRRGGVGRIFVSLFFLKLVCRFFVVLDFNPISAFRSYGS